MLKLYHPSHLILDDMHFYLIKSNNIIKYLHNDLNLFSLKCHGRYLVPIY
jgi:hypothetical protein